MAPVTDEQAERVRDWWRRYRRPGRHLRRHRLGGRAFQPSHRRLDHADRLVGPAVASRGPSVGTPAPHLATRQLERLRAEGVLAENGRIPLPQYRFPL
jgi:hypothetical protein